MLPRLNDTDVCSVVPDIDGLDLWSKSYSPQDVPAKPGVYCFYDADTGEVLYIGSTCSRSAEYHQSGLVMRLQFYRSAGVRKMTSSVKKVLAERTKRRILVRLWIAQYAGDARKYECDAIEKYRPLLNYQMSCKVLSAEHHRIRRCQSTKDKMAEYRARPRSELPSEDTVKLCSGCATKKPLSEFAKNVCRKDGHRATCKVCQKKEGIELRSRYASLSDSEKPSEDSLKVCCDCGKEKSRKSFHNSRNAKDGRQSFCKACATIRRRNERRAKRKAQTGESKPYGSCTKLGCTRRATWDICATNGMSVLRCGFHKTDKGLTVQMRRAE